MSANPLKLTLRNYLFANILYHIFVSDQASSFPVNEANLNEVQFAFSSLNLFSLRFRLCRLWVGDYWMRKVVLNFNACGNWEILNAELNSLTGSLRLQRLQAISQIFTWNNPIKLEQSYGQVLLVSHILVLLLLCTTFNVIGYFVFSCIWLVWNSHLAT